MGKGARRQGAAAFGRQRSDTGTQAIKRVYQYRYRGFRRLAPPHARGMEISYSKVHTVTPFRWDDNRRTSCP